MANSYLCLSVLSLKIVPNVRPVSKAVLVTLTSLGHRTKIKNLLWK